MTKQHPKNYIKEIREQRGLTLEQLARLVGVTNPQISMLERSKRGLTWPMVQKLAGALGCHPSDITDGPGFMIAAKDDFEREVLEELRGLNDSAKQMFLSGLKASKAAQEPATTKKDNAVDDVKKHKG